MNDPTHTSPWPNRLAESINRVEAINRIVHEKENSVPFEPRPIENETCAICGNGFDEESWDVRHTSHVDGISDVHDVCCTAVDCVGFICECSEDDGPCEAHIEVLSQREGGNTRTADQLNSLFISEAVDLGVVLSIDDQALLDEVDAHLEEDHYLPFDTEGDLVDALYSLRDRVDSDLHSLYYERGEHLFVNFEDGYVIGKILPGSPLLR